MNLKSTATAETDFPTGISLVPVQTLAHDLQRRNAWAKRIGGVALIGLSLSLLTSGKAEAISFTFEMIVDSNTPIPAGTGNFGFFSSPSLNNGNVAFGGASPDFEEGIYTSINGVLDVVADTNTPIPKGTGNFGFFSSPSLDDGNVAFGGVSPDFEEGIYTSINGVLDVVADTNTPIPGGTGNFEFLSSPSLDNRNMAFEGITAGVEEGIYTSINGVLDVVADSNTPIPGGTGNFGSFFSPSLNNGNVVFQGVSPDFEQDGIYTNIGGTLAEVIAIGSLLDDKEVSFLDFESESFSGNQIAFGVEFTDDSSAIYIATAVPEPSSVLGTLAFGAFGARYMLKHREKKQKLTSREKRVT